MEEWKEIIIMSKHFLDLEIGDRVICLDEYSGGTSYHTLVIDSYEDDEEYATETNPLGRRFWEQTKII